MQHQAHGIAERFIFTPYMIQYFPLTVPPDAWCTHKPQSFLLRLRHRNVAKQTVCCFLTAMSQLYFSHEILVVSTMKRYQQPTKGLQKWGFGATLGIEMLCERKYREPRSPKTRCATHGKEWYKKTRFHRSFLVPQHRKTRGFIGKYAYYCEHTAK